MTDKLGVLNQKNRTNVVCSRAKNGMTIVKNVKNVWNSKRFLKYHRRFENVSNRIKRQRSQIEIVDRSNPYIAISIKRENLNAFPVQIDDAQPHQKRGMRHGDGSTKKWVKYYWKNLRSANRRSVPPKSFSNTSGPCQTKKDTMLSNKQATITCNTRATRLSSE